MMLDVSELDCDCLLTVEEIKEDQYDDYENSSCANDNKQEPHRSSGAGDLITFKCHVNSIVSRSPDTSSVHLSPSESEIKQDSTYHRYECNICHKSFKASDTLKEHYRVKHEHIVYGCPSCRITLRSKSGFRRHIRQCHADGVTSQYSLPARRRRNRSVDEQDDNSSKTTLPILDDRSYVGRHCSKVGLSDLVESYSVESDETDERTSKLIAQPKSIQTARINSQTIDNSNNHRREKVESITLSPSRERLRRMGFNNVGCVDESLMSKLRCELCSRIFVYRKSLLSHLAKHADGTLNVVKSRADVYTCYFCQHEFSSERLVAEHMSEVHTEVQCAMCDVLCHGDNELRAHVRDQHHMRCDERKSFSDVIDEYRSSVTVMEHSEQQTFNECLVTDCKNLGAMDSGDASNNLFIDIVKN